jgi:hypothetical protein
MKVPDVLTQKGLICFEEITDYSILNDKPVNNSKNF